jgi:polysaccharide biosynthesis protein PslH
MKIFYVVPYVPNRIRVRPYEILRTLARRDHQITLATLWSNAQERADLQRLADAGIKIVAQPLSRVRSWWNCVRVLPSRMPLQAVYCWQPAFAQELERLLQETKFDVVHVEHLRGARYALHLSQVICQQMMPTPVVWDSVDCISHLFAQAARSSHGVANRLLTKLELARTQRYEGWLVQHFDRILLTSQTDRQALYALGVQSGSPIGLNPDHLAVLPNGVDLDYFCPQESTRSGPADGQRPATIIFSGKMSYHANVTAALYLVRDIMPRVWLQCPDVTVQLVGKDPPPSLRALATQGVGHVEAQGSRHRCVEVTGTVPDLPPYLQRATVAVAPVLYSAGIQNKVLEAMACGTPVVASAQAAAGIDACPGHDFLVADDPQGFADQILCLLHDSQRCRELGAAGRAYVERYHSWQGIVHKLEEIYQIGINQ